MFGLFKSKKKQKNVDQTKEEKSAELRRQVQQQIKEKRAEMDPETLEKLEQALRIKKAKEKVKSVVDEEDRRGDVVSGIRNMREEEK
mgnify:CR=1 FL=1